MGFREDFIEIYKNFIKRQGTEELLNWLLTTDFFVAPASTKYHCACEGGLVQHSVSVYKTLRETLKSSRTQKKVLLYADCCTIYAKLSFIRFRRET